MTIETEDGEEQVWHIFGEDEVNVEKGILSWRSPLARALLGKKEGDDVQFLAPGGVRELEVMDVS